MASSHGRLDLLSEAQMRSCRIWACGFSGNPTCRRRGMGGTGRGARGRGSAGGSSCRCSRPMAGKWGGRAMAENHPELLGEMALRAGLGGGCQRSVELRQLCLRLQRRAGPASDWGLRQVDGDYATGDRIRRPLMLARPSSSPMTREHSSPGSGRLPPRLLASRRQRTSREQVAGPQGRPPGGKRADRRGVRSPAAPGRV
jgi:hypothetical protein